MRTRYLFPALGRPSLEHPAQFGQHISGRILAGLNRFRKGEEGETGPALSGQSERIKDAHSREKRMEGRPDTRLTLGASREATGKMVRIIFQAPEVTDITFNSNTV